MTGKFAQNKWTEISEMERSRIVLFVILILLSCFDKIAISKTYKYDNLHRLTRVVYDNGTQITYSYDEVGNRTRRVSTLMADTSIDGSVDFQDFAVTASRWLEEDCGYADEWCHGSDIDWSTTVDFKDLALISQQWLECIP